MDLPISIDLSLVCGNGEMENTDVFDEKINDKVLIPEGTTRLRSLVLGYVIYGLDCCNKVTACTRKRAQQ